MFYFLSKTIYVVLMPAFWLLLLLVGALFSAKKHKNKWILGCLIFWLVSANPYLSNKLMLWWEIPPTPWHLIRQQQYDAAIILSGVTNNSKSPKDRVYMEYAADRVMHAARLYREGIVKHIVITGGYYSLGADTIENESEQLRQVLLLAGVPTGAITVEGRAMNTRENALFTAPILQEKFPNGKFLLVTSAFHQRRALACFRKVGIEATPFSTHFYTFDEHQFSLFSALLPSEMSFFVTYKAVHEIVGYIVYKLVGYL
ncbi:MAG: YdcF family protein [Cytophagales bacterium]|nr:YdcF family protein [Cytophagales bacterium]MDW8383845.1 YdcF family protein [Flammeovirgaceae bacterium]